MLVTFAVLTAALAAFLFAGGLFVQRVLYSEPARLLPVRAVVGGLILAGFLTGWTYANTRAPHKDKYGTLFEFNSTAFTDVEAFDAVRWLPPIKDGKPAREATVAFRRQDRTRFVQADDASAEFKLYTPDYMTAALEVKEGEAKTRFDAEIDANGRYKNEVRVFRDKAGRTVEFGKTNNPGPIQAPSRGALVAALLLNLGVFVVWFVVLWPVMRFTVAPAVGLAAALGGVTMLLLMPLLFDKNQVPQAAAKPVVKSPV